MEPPAQALGWLRLELPSGSQRSWSASHGGGAAGDGTGEAGGFITTAAHGAAGAADIGHPVSGIAPVPWFIATARDTAATGATAHRIIGRPDPSIAREPGRGSPILLVVREIVRPGITGRRVTIGLLTMDGRRSSRYDRVRPTTGQLPHGRPVASLLPHGLPRRTGLHSKTGQLLPRTGPRRRARRTGRRDHRNLTEAIGGRGRPLSCCVLAFCRW